MGLFNRLERLLGRFAIPNISLYLVAGQVVFWSVSFLGFFDLERILLVPALVRYEPWRLVTFLFLPPASSPVFIAFAWYLFYLMGSALEQYWGVFRYNCFLLLGWALTVGVAFLYPEIPAVNVFLAGSVFLAFAFLNPDFELLIFFILPVKIKWLALIQWAFYGFALIFGSWPIRLAAFAAVGNFLIFFARDIVQRVRTGRRRMEHTARQAAARNTDEPRHRCVVCGKTDLTHPREDFRYGDDDQCYCSEHRPSAAKRS
jgi:membrane associated rhomboid family serine protease